MLSRACQMSAVCHRNGTCGNQMEEYCFIFLARYVLSFHDFVVFIYLFFGFFADLLNCDACGKKKSNEK